MGPVEVRLDIQDDTIDELQPDKSVPMGVAEDASNVLL